MVRLQDESFFKSWLTGYLTSPPRYRGWKARPFFLRKAVVEEEEEGSIATEEGGSDDEPFEDEDDDDGEGDFLPIFLQEPHRVASHRLFESSEEVLEMVLLGQLLLRRCESLRMGYTSSGLLVDGVVKPRPSLLSWEVSSSLLHKGIPIRIGGAGRL